jgi:phosphoglycolate phosphatase
VYKRQQLEQYYISDYFIAITGKTNHYASGKEELAEVHMDKLDISTSNIVFVGDTMHDVEVAKIIGCDYIIVSHGHQDIEYLSKGKLKTAHDLKDVVDSILNRK